jgi:hypothetical protein
MVETLKGGNPELRQKKAELVKEVALHRGVDLSCLGCTDFLEQGMNIKDSSVSNCRILPFPFCRRFRDYETEIKDQICCLLNSGGGLLVFGCEVKALSVVVKGESLSEKQKEVIEHQLACILEEFHPKVDIHRCVMLSFVPVVANPYEDHGPLELCSYTGE